MSNLILFPCRADKSPDVRGSWKVFNKSYYDAALLRLSEGCGLVGVVIPNGYFLIDVDSYKPTSASLAEIDSALGCSLDWKNALVQTTRSGGSHFLFRLTENVDGSKLPNTTNLLGLKHVDSRADGGRGYVCVGQGYRAHGVFEQLHTGFLLDGSPVLPEKAIETLLGGGLGGDDRATSVEAEVECDEFELEQALSAIDAKTFNEYSTWVTLLLASHKASGGMRWGLLAFDKVSREKGAAGGEYESFQDISYRWNNASRSGSADAAGFGTIMEKAKLGDHSAFEKIVAERKTAAVISGFDIEPVEDDTPDDEGVSANGHEYSERFRTLRGRIDFALEMNAKVCFWQTKDDFTYFEVTDEGFTEKVRGAALRAAAELVQGFEFEACEEDVFEMINEFNDLYTGAAVFGVVPEFIRRKFLIIEYGSKNTLVFIRNKDSSWSEISQIVFDSVAGRDGSFKGFLNNVKRFNPKATKTWEITPFWVMYKFYRTAVLTGDTYEIFMPRVITLDDSGYNQKLNKFQPYRALTLCRDVKSGADVGLGLGQAQLLIRNERAVADAWHVFQQFIFQLVGADVGRIGDDGCMNGGGVGGGSWGMSEREYWARMLIASLASTVQRPEVRREWALILKGAQGVGKSTITRIMQKVLDDNVTVDGGMGRVAGWNDYCSLKSGTGENSKVGSNKLNRVIGRFNSALRGKLLCVIEELDVDEKISTSDELKDILTSSVINIEAKGVDTVTEKSYLNFYIFSNKDMPMMLGAERRFSVIETALRDDHGMDAVNEYMAGIRFTHVDGRDFIEGGPVPKFDKDLWLDEVYGDGSLSDEGAIRQHEYLLRCAEYKTKYFQKLNSELIENENGVKALGAALALVDISRYCPDFNLKEGFASRAKNEMQSKSTGESSISAIDSARLARFHGQGGLGEINGTTPVGNNLCDWLWGVGKVGAMIGGSQLILKDFQAGVLFGAGSGTEMLDERRAALVDELHGRVRGNDVMVDMVVRVIESMSDPLLNPYVVDLRQLSDDCMMHGGGMGGGGMRAVDRSSVNNHLKSVRYALSSLGYVPYIDLFKRSGGTARGIKIRTERGASSTQKWLKVDSLYVFGGSIDGKPIDLGISDYKLVRLLFSAAHKG